MLEKLPHVQGVVHIGASELEGISGEFQCYFKVKCIWPNKKKLCGFYPLIILLNARCLMQLNYCVPFIV